MLLCLVKAALVGPLIGEILILHKKEAAVQLQCLLVLTNRQPHVLVLSDQGRSSFWSRYYMHMLGHPYYQFLSQFQGHSLELEVYHTSSPSSGIQIDVSPHINEPLLLSPALSLCFTTYSCNSSSRLSLTMSIITAQGIMRHKVTKIFTLVA